MIAKFVIRKTDDQEFYFTFHLSKEAVLSSRFFHSKSEAQNGIEAIRQHAIDFIKTRIASQYPKNDGKQTPMKGHPVFIAQHATATCCRGCMQKWHEIKKGRALSDQEIQFLLELIIRWIESQIGAEK